MTGLDELERRFGPPPPRRFSADARTYAIASGKGGVGKTWLAVTLAHTLVERGSRVLLFDGDLGLANVDVQLGLMPPRDLGAVLGGRLSLEEALIDYAPGGFQIIAGVSGTGQLASVPPATVAAVGAELRRLAQRYDATLIDVGAGVSRTVRQLVGIAHVCIVVVTDEPTSLTDGYALVKLMRAERPDTTFAIVVNGAASHAAGERTHATLAKACRNFLGIDPPLLGVVRRDRWVPDAIRHQTPLSLRHPRSEAVADVRAIAARLAE